MEPRGNMETQKREKTTKEKTEQEENLDNHVV